MASPDAIRPFTRSPLLGSAAAPSVSPAKYREQEKHQPCPSVYVA